MQTAIEKFYTLKATANRPSPCEEADDSASREMMTQKKFELKNLVDPIRIWLRFLLHSYLIWVSRL